MLARQAVGRTLSKAEVLDRHLGPLTVDDGDGFDLGLGHDLVLYLDLSVIAGLAEKLD